MNPAKRHTDGSFRGNKQPIILKMRNRIGAWLEAEAMALKASGFSYQAIANHCMKVARKQEAPLAMLEADIVFPEDYKVTLQAVALAFRRGLRRDPIHRQTREESLTIGMQRLEMMFLSLTKGIQNGAPNAINAGVRIVMAQALLKGCLPNGMRRATDDLVDRLRNVTPSPDIPRGLPMTEEEKDQYALTVLDVVRAAVINIATESAVNPDVLNGSVSANGNEPNGGDVNE